MPMSIIVSSGATILLLPHPVHDQDHHGYHDVCLHLVPYRLYWYKSPSDLDSLGDVDVLAAAFEVVVEDPKNLTTFKIK